MDSTRDVSIGVMITNVYLSISGMQKRFVRFQKKGLKMLLRCTTQDVRMQLSDMKSKVPNWSEIV